MGELYLAGLGAPQDEVDRRQQAGRGEGLPGLCVAGGVLHHLSREEGHPTVDSVFEVLQQRGSQVLNHSQRSTFSTTNSFLQMT